MGEGSGVTTFGACAIGGSCKSSGAWGGGATGDTGDIRPTGRATAIVRPVGKRFVPLLVSTIMTPGLCGSIGATLRTRTTPSVGSKYKSPGRRGAALILLIGALLAAAPP